ncbi:MAG: MFS transporter [Planctomycetes bacterium]|nr:MFS transporter [Planctomycetota bacterium]
MHAETPPIAAIDRPGKRLRTASWVVYDLANTVYAAVVTYVFAPHVTAVLGDRSAPVGVVQSASMILAAVLVPALGALADQTARARSYLAISTLLCIGALASLGLAPAGAEGAPVLLTGFFVANVTYNLGLLFYNMLLPSVAHDAEAGQVSGLGVGTGYVGTIVVLVALVLPGYSPSATFLAAAALFLVTAAPCMVLVRDVRRPARGSNAGAVRAAARELGATLRDLPRHPPLLWFLLGNFCLVDVLNTAVLFFASFTKALFANALGSGTLTFAGKTFAGDAGATDLVVIVGLALNGLALPFGIAAGRWTDRAPLTVMKAAAIALLVALGGGAAYGGTSLPGYIATLAVFGSFGLAAVWTAGRKVVLALAPRERLGQYFGLYGITLKVSVVGGAIYGVVADACGHRAAMVVQAVPLLIGLACLAMVRLPTTRPTSPA